MHFHYDESLSKEDRKMFTERLIKLHTILGEDTTTEYNHDVWTREERNGFWKRLRTGHACNTSACAMGHALLHADQFPGLKYVSLDEEYRGLIAQAGLAFQPAHPTDESFAYFGPHSHRYIFSTIAYGIETPTRAVVMNRIEDYITKVLGCELIEA